MRIPHTFTPSLPGRLRLTDLCPPPMSSVVVSLSSSFICRVIPAVLRVVIELMADFAKRPGSPVMLLLCRLLDEIIQTLFTDIRLWPPSLLWGHPCRTVA